MTSGSLGDTIPAEDQPLIEAVDGGFPAAIDDLGHLVRIPGIAWPAFDQQQLVASADRIASLAEETGLFDTVEIKRAPLTDAQDGELGQPAVLAVRAARAGRPTVMLYAHHDVQPPGDDELWNTPPFEPTVRDGRIYARGAADDKAGVMTHIASLRALAEVVGTENLDVGLVLFIEGEEEYGSRSFAPFLAENAEQMRSDVIVVADSGNWDSTTPALTVSLRGNTTFHLTVRTLDHASHSGMFGGAVPDAMMATIRLLNSLWDENGAVAVDGLAVRDTATPEYDEAMLRDETGLLNGVQPIGDGTILSRIWNKPTVTVTGIDHTSVAHASNTLAPEITVVVSCRVAPGQSAADAYEAIRTHLLNNAPYGAHLSFSEVDLGDGFLVDTTGWAVEEVRAALADGYDAEPVDYGVGGSIPFISDLVERFPEAQILVTGVEDPHSRAHSPNESLHIDTFRHAIRSETLMLARMNRRTKP
ncbi:dipeptidase [Microbacterium amylolyticum]|uniref:Acetylornithine deacetylase/succinyl-diaminopimelate desuccinylase-like protein n=1 Tax=Microbacterium amylolyticum TaxID=936337 RepID=A0ABS4ZFB3_9MICO|nr:dipeptidase [Microbacterium amylolyticum]MBP2435973.1 acetylornithine deacetylase/succinyl-diaminopimelate desuccinylase-like protein [Microbacterium amylolyticum]